MPIGAAESAKDKGNAAFKAGDLPLALANYSTAIQLDPSSAIYLQNRALVHIKLKQWQQAEADATRAFKLDPASAKALYRRGLARVGAGGKVEQARGDFEDALRLGGGPEVQKELEKLPVRAQPVSTEPVSAQAKEDAPASSTSSGSASAQTDRLKAALAPKPAPSTPPAASTQPELTREGGKNSTTSSPLPAGELMKEVSTRRLSPASVAGGSFFAQKKEQRQTRLGSGFGGAKPAPTAASTGVKPDPAQDQPPPAPVSSTSTAAPALAQPAPPTVPFEQLSLAEQEIALSPAWQSIAGTQYNLPTQPPAAPSVSSPTATGSRGKERAAPSTWASFEREWMASKPLSPQRSSMLQSLSPSVLPALIGDALTPDLLSDMVRTLAAEPSEEAEEGWEIELLRGLTKVRRFEVGVMFLDEPDKTLLRGVFSRAYDALAKLWNQFDLQPITDRADVPF